MEAVEKNIALVGYHDPVFWPFAQRLETDGLRVHWINSAPLASQRLRTLGVADDRICDVLGEDWPSLTEKECLDELSQYEQPGLPTVNSIIFMDQELRHLPYPEALTYLAVCARSVCPFIAERGIMLVSSGRDSALQMMTMLICKKLGIFFGCVTRVKLPKEWFGFSPTHQGDHFYRLRQVESRDLVVARQWLDDFRSGMTAKPFARPKISGFEVIFKHLRRLVPVLFSHLKFALASRTETRGARTGLYQHVERYWSFFRNYCHYRFRMKFYRPADEPFVLYGLHRQPESSIDVRGAFFDDQLALIKQIVRSMPATHKLYVKVHFSDVAGQSPSFYRTLLSYPAVKLIDPDVESRGLLLRAAVIVTNVGAMGQEGGYLGRPVIAMSKMFWSNLPTVRYCGTPGELPDLIREMIETPPADDYDRVVRALAGYLANNVPCDPNLSFLGKGLSDRDLDVLSQMYRHVYSLCSAGEVPVDAQ